MTEPDEQDAYRGRWLASLLLRDRTPDEPPVTIEFRTGEEAVNSELTYDLRSGEADSLDQMVAITFANIAVDLIRDDAAAGRMIAIVDGKYAFVDIPEPGNPRKVDVSTMYDLDRFRPQYHNRLGKPMMLASRIGDAVLAG